MKFTPKNEDICIYVPEGPFRDTYECLRCGETKSQDAADNYETCSTCGATLVNKG